MINLVKINSFNTCLFEQLYKKTDAEHNCLLLHTEMQWLSKKSSNRVFELRETQQRFLLEKESLLENNFNDEQWVFKLAYLCNMFNLLKELNLLLQEKMTIMFKLADKVA